MRRHTTCDECDRDDDKDNVAPPARAKEKVRGVWGEEGKSRKEQQCERGRGVGGFQFISVDLRHSFLHSLIDSWIDSS